MLTEINRPTLRSDPVVTSCRAGVNPHEIAVVIASYNAERTILDAVRSVLTGSMACTVYVVDDNSRIPVENFLQDYKDRLVIVRLNQNRGPAGARNTALEMILAADFKYAAIMDADDISAPGRLATQFAFMENHPDVGACGTAIREFFDDPVDDSPLFERPAGAQEVRNLMYFNIGISHASAMFRCEALRKVGIYSPQFPVAEDYELLWRIQRVYKLANIPECLVYYRISPGGQSQSRAKRQLFDRLMIQLKYFEPGNWRAWAGAGRTVLMLAAPRTLIQLVKNVSSRGH